MRTTPVPVAVAAAVLLSLAACGTDDDQTTGDAAEPAAEGDRTSVEIVDNDFEPAGIEVGEGETVTWENVGAVAHTVTFDDEGSGDLEPGDTYDQTFEEAGEFGYVCSIHPAMEATVTVAG